jgi:hypothetical protein
MPDTNLTHRNLRIPIVNRNYRHDVRYTVLLVVETSMLNNMQVTMTQDGRLPLEPGFDLRPVSVEFSVYKVVLG